jgi:hypothetical protein
MRKWKEAVLLLTLLSLAWCLAGCPPQYMTSPSTPPPTPPTNPITASGNPVQDVLLVEIRMLGIEVPVGAASGSEDIWSYVEEESVLAGGTALGRNGFRVGLARRDHWPSLERILKQLAGRQARESTLTVLPNNPIPIVLKPKQPAQTFFVFRADRTLSGQDYPPSDNLLTILCALNEEEPNQLVVFGQPQLRSLNETQQVFEENRGYLFVNRPKVYDLPDLSFRLSVPNGDIVVIGPGAAARRPASAARHFLLKEKDGMEFETVLLLIPRVVRGRAQVVPTPLPELGPPLLRSGSP